MFACLVLLGTAPGTGWAKPNFPPHIADHLHTASVPACSICHLDGKIGGITVVTPFALALRAHGFDGSSGTLDAALDQLDAQRVDSDGDGTSDVDELRAGTDPNSPAPGATTADPSYGCAVAPSPAVGELGLVTMAIAVLLLTLRRGRRVSR